MKFDSVNPQINGNLESLAEKRGFVFKGSGDISRISPIENEQLEEVVQTLADTLVTDARGSSAATAYMLEPRVWIREIVQAGRKRFRYAEFSYQTDIARGNKNIIIPRRKNYLATSAWGANVTPGTAVNFTTLNNFDGTEIAPAWKNKGVAVSYDVIQQNALNYVELARDELSYGAGDDVDQALVGALSGATLSTSTAAGMQQIFGGSAGAASGLVAGDIMTTAMVAEGMRKLQTDVVRYWSGSVEAAVAKATAVKNPWINDDDFVLLISPEQEEAFRTDSQFVNAAEYGGNTPRATGEIGNYLGCKIVTSVNTKFVAADAVGTIDTSTAAVAMNSCFMFKAAKGPAIGYQKRPTLHVVDFPRELEVDLILEQSYGTGIIHTDSIVAINVAQI